MRFFAAVALVASSSALLVAGAADPGPSTTPVKCYSYQCPLVDGNGNPLDVATTTYNGRIAKCTYYNAQFMVDVGTCNYNRNTGKLKKATVGEECRTTAMTATIPCAQKRAWDSEWAKEEALEKRQLKARKLVELENKVERRGLGNLKKRKMEGEEMEF